MIRKVPWVEDAIKEMNMQDEERELVEMMAESVRAYRTQMSITTMAEQMLSVIKANLGKIAKICPCCNGKKIVSDTRGGEHVMLDEPCMACLGTGIVPKGK